MERRKYLHHGKAATAALMVSTLSLPPLSDMMMRPSNTSSRILVAVTPNTGWQDQSKPNNNNYSFLTSLTSLLRNNKVATTTTTTTITLMEQRQPHVKIPMAYILYVVLLLDTIRLIIIVSRE
jgi:hypothetical protein